MLMAEDLPLFYEIKKRLSDDLMFEIEQKRKLVMKQTENAPNPLSLYQASKYANAEVILRSMSGRKASKAIGMIVDFYTMISQTAEHQRYLTEKRSSK